jgi:hypothetical protein
MDVIVLKKYYIVISKNDYLIDFKKENFTLTCHEHKQLIHRKNYSNIFYHLKEKLIYSTSD